MPRFAANLTMMFNEWPFLDRFAAAADAGFEAVEFLFPYEHSPDEIARRLASHGLSLALFNLPPGDWAAGERGLAALSGREEEIKAGTRRALDYVEATGARQVHLMAGITDRVSAEAQANYRRAVSSVAERLGQAGVTLMIEPINRRDMPGYFLDDFGYAERMISDLGLPNLKLQFDVYHRQIMHGDVTVALRTLMPIIGHIQVASVPSRHEPDGEELSYPHIFKTLDSLGYAGYVGCEYRPRNGTLPGLGWLADSRARN
jgi:hydroxypyruvate isomerase